MWSSIERDRYRLVLSYHEDHLNELGGVVGETTAEPEQRKHASQPDVGREHLADGHACVAAVVENRARQIMSELRDAKNKENKALHQ